MKALKEKLFQLMVYTVSLFTIIILAAIITTIFKTGLPIFTSIGIPDFLGSSSWHPTSEPVEFGIFSLIVGSLLVTFGAMCLALPLGVGSAIYISEIAGHKTRELLKPVIELLAAIPSVIYGLFGMAFLAPLVRQVFHLDSGLNAFTASLILGMMVVPIIASITEDALSTVPKSLREASLALGATRWETITLIVVPAARTGIIGGVILGFGRAIGETMVVLMVAGGATKLPHSFFDPVRPMTSAIAAEMGEAVNGSQHFQALFGIAIILFFITFITNLITELIFMKRRAR